MAPPGAKYVAIIMGSQSDWQTMKHAAETLDALGVKGVGEAGTTASISAVMNAVADAVPGGAGAHLDMPVTAARLWQACRRGAAGQD